MTRHRAGRAAALALALLAISWMSATIALAATPKADLVDIEDEVMCTTCKVPLNIAEGDQPDSERNRIRELIAQGLTKEQIKRVLVDEYGEDVLALPQTSGVGLTAYAIPLALGAALVAALVLLLPRWRRRPAAGMAGAKRAADGDDAAAISAADAKRLDEDLARYDA